MKKKPTQKAAAPKKVAKAPAPKLIDGKYSHAFILRLEPQVGKALDEIIKKYKFNVNSKAVYLALNKHLDLINEVDELSAKVINLTQQNSNLKDVVYNYIRSSKALNEVIASKTKDNSIGKGLSSLLDQKLIECPECDYMNAADAYECANCEHILD